MESGQALIKLIYRTHASHKGAARYSRQNQGHDIIPKLWQLVAKTLPAKRIRDLWRREFDHMPAIEREMDIIGEKSGKQGIKR